MKESLSKKLERAKEDFDDKIKSQETELARANLGVNMKGYSAIKNGKSYKQVVNILGE